MSGSGSGAEVDALPAFGFAEPGPLRDTLTKYALAGPKVATAGLRVELELDGEPIPTAGDLSALLDSAGRRIAIVETTSCRLVRLADVDDAHAIDEGEGYANSHEFRVAHERYWNGNLGQLRERLGDPAFRIDDDTEVAAERFRIRRILSDAPDSRVVVRPTYPADRPVVDAFLAANNADVNARHGELVDARVHPALLAEVEGTFAGALTWIVDGDALEVHTLHAVGRFQGVGTALLAAARRVAEVVGCRRMWVVTTNDNVDALRFYQRRGMRLARVNAGAVDLARATLKPSIPETGAHGIPIRDELVLETEVHRG
jgi:uncharacterized protein YhfF/N-acetylglutamate synthase-like GNAT family acetyltransferase